MNLGVLLTSGDSLEKQLRSGQFERFGKFYLANYARDFESVLVFSYGQDSKFKKRRSFKLIVNKLNLHRYLYTLFMPFLHRKIFKRIDVLRVMQVTGAAPAILAKIFFRMPFVVTYGFKYHQFAKIEGKWFQAIVLKFFEILVIKIADGVIVTTNDLRNYVTQFTNYRKIYFIPNGVDTDSFKPAVKKDSHQNFEIVSVGRLEKQKNYANLIKAIAQSKYRTKIHLSLVGQGSLKSELEKLAKNLSVDLRIIDSIPHAKMPGFLQDADIFVLPSLIEGHPKVLLEAMACGLPSLGSRVSGNVEIIEDYQNGLLCDIGYLNIRQKLDQLIKDEKLRQKISKKAWEFVRRNYNLQKLIDQEILILKQFAKNA